MRQVLGWLLVMVLCCAARGEAGEAQPDARRVEAQAAFDEATKLQDAGRYSEAVARAEQALAIQEAALGDKHPDVAQSLNQLARLFMEQGLFSRASALREAMRSLRASRPHPHDWAPFIALGSDAPLRSIVPAEDAGGRSGPGAAPAPSARGRGTSLRTRRTDPPGP